MGLEARKTRLLELRAELNRRLEQLNRTVHAGLEADSEERAAQIANDEIRERLRVEAQSELNEVENALTRIEQGSYGTCQGCGQPIEEQRLDAYPMAAACVKCAGRASRRS